MDETFNGKVYRGCPTCNTLRAIASVDREAILLLRKTVGTKVSVNSILLSICEVHFCPNCGRALKRDAFEHKKKVLKNAIARCPSCYKRQR